MEIQINILFLIYGCCIMFYAMATWFFANKNKEFLSRLGMLLSGVIMLECIKDLFVISSYFEITDCTWNLITAMDMIVVPLYAFILTELCRPGKLTIREMAIHETPFILLPILYATTEITLFYYLNVGLAAVYGLYYFIWTWQEIPRYNARLKEFYSYKEGIDLSWLRSILISFFSILLIWVTDCVGFNIYVEYIYLISTLILWMFICYFLYRHNSVIDEILKMGATEGYCISDSGETDASEIGRRIKSLFYDDEIYLNPNLKLSDIAKAIGTNRTYVSTFFNKEARCTFYDYVNKLRVDYACNLLVGTKESLNLIAEKSGFNSSQSFIRVFNKIKGISPTKYRATALNN